MADIENWAVATDRKMHENVRVKVRKLQRKLTLLRITNPFVCSPKSRVEVCVSRLAEWTRNEIQSPLPSDAK